MQDPPELVSLHVRKYAVRRGSSEDATATRQKRASDPGYMLMHPCAIKAVKVQPRHASSVPAVLQSSALRTGPPEIPSAFTTFRPGPSRQTDGAVGIVGVNRAAAAATLNELTAPRAYSGANVSASGVQRLQLLDVDAGDRRRPVAMDCMQVTGPDRGAVHRAAAVDVSEVAPLLGSAANWDDPGNSDDSDYGRAAGRKDRNRKGFMGGFTDCASLRQDYCSII